MAEEPLGADSNRDLGKREGTQVPSSSPSDLGLGGGGRSSGAGAERGSRASGIWDLTPLCSSASFWILPLEEKQTLQGTVQELRAPPWPCRKTA